MIRKFFLRIFALVRYSVCFFAICFFCVGGASLLLADELEDLYGPQLKSVSYAVRVQYEKQNAKPWSAATYDERSNFLATLNREEMVQKMVQERETYTSEQAEMRKTIARDAEKNVQARKEYDRQRVKDNREYAEQRKKDEYMKKSMRQQQKILKSTIQR